MTNPGDKNKGKGKQTADFDAEAFKKGIANIESGDRYDALPWYINEETGKKELLSSAAGKYQFLWKELAKSNPQLFSGMTKEDFLNSPELQEKVMDLAISGGLKNRPSYLRNAKDLTNEFKKEFGEDWNFRPDEVAVLTHFLGRGGARDYLRSLLNEDNYKVDGKINAEPLEYLDRYNKAIGRTRGLSSRQYPYPVSNHIPSPTDLERGRLSMNTAVRDNLDYKDVMQELPNLFGNIESNPDLIKDFQQMSGTTSSAPTTQPVSAKQEVQKNPMFSSVGFIENYLGTMSNEYALGGTIDPPKTNTVELSKDFVSNWINDPITRTKLADNLRNYTQAQDLANKGLANIKDTKTFQFDRGTGSARAEYQGGNVSLFGDPNSRDLVHEYTHASGLDVPLTDFINQNYGNPLQALRGNTGASNTREAVSQQFGIDPSTTFGKDKVTKQIQHASYIGRDGEIYPRIMEARQALQLQPGQEVTDEHINTLFSTGENELINYYSKDQLKSILNTVASIGNTNNLTNMAALGGPIDPPKGGKIDPSYFLYSQ